MRTRHRSHRCAHLAGLLCAAGFLSIAGIGYASADEICRVTTAGNGANDGSDWTMPMDLQAALGDAICTEIWVAAGAYKPGAAQTESFSIGPDVAVYGGFAGGETLRDERDPGINVTVLSGDIDNNDTHAGDSGIDETSADIIGSNSFHVVFLDGTSGASITATTVLDGFTITGGDATTGSGFPADNGGGLHCQGNLAGHACSPTLGNVTFSGNRADYGGGAMFNFGENGSSSPTLSDVVFSGNSAALAGALYNFGYNGGSASPTLNNVTFTGNGAIGFGAAMVNDSGFDGFSSPTLGNVTFGDNVCAGSSCRGGAIFNQGHNGGTTEPILDNVTFSGNSAGYGGAMYNEGDTGGNASPILSNVILWGDVATTSGPEIYNNTQGGTAMPGIDHSIVQGSGGSASWDTALGEDGGGNLDADPALGTLADNGGTTATFVPGTDGAAIDTGNDAVCSAAPVNGLDQRGVPRPQGPHCDIGAVENDGLFADGFDG